MAEGGKQGRHEQALRAEQEHDKTAGGVCRGMAVSRCPNEHVELLASDAQAKAEPLSGDVIWCSHKM